MSCSKRLLIQLGMCEYGFLSASHSFFVAKDVTSHLRDPAPGDAEGETKVPKHGCWFPNLVHDKPWVSIVCPMVLVAHSISSPSIKTFFSSRADWGDHVSTRTLCGIPRLKSFSLTLELSTHRRKAARSTADPRLRRVGVSVVALKEEDIW